MTSREYEAPPISSADFDSDLKRHEEAKRERLVDPKVRWRVLQQAIVWTDQQKHLPRNTREACIRKQTIILAGMARENGSQVDVDPVNRP